MVQVGGLVQQFHIGETDAEKGGADPPAIPGGDADAQQAQRRKVGVHSPAGPGLYPAEPRISKVMGGRNVEGINPAVGEKAGDRQQPQQAEQDAKGGYGCAVHRAECPPFQILDDCGNCRHCRKRSAGCGGVFRCAFPAKPALPGIAGIWAVIRK